MVTFADSEATFFLPRLANRFHVRTHPEVVEQELLFRPGEPYDSASVSETARNLRRLGIVRLVRIDSAMSDTGLIVRVTTQDGWSTKPEFAFRSTGGQVAWRVSLVEENFLGSASRLLLGYTKDPDRSAFVFGIRRPRLIARSIVVRLPVRRPVRRFPADGERAAAVSLALGPPRLGRLDRPAGRTHPPVLRGRLRGVRGAPGRGAAGVRTDPVVGPLPQRDRREGGQREQQRPTPAATPAGAPARATAPAPAAAAATQATGTPGALPAADQPPGSPPQEPRADANTAERVYVLRADLGYATLQLDFLVYKPGGGFGRVNGQDVAPGTIVDGFTVEEIGPDYIRLRDARGPLVLRTR